MSDIEKMNLESVDLVAERIHMLKGLFPEIMTEGEGAIDFDKLRLLLGDNVNDVDERYTFTWPGKAAAIRQSQLPASATLRPLLKKSRGRDGKDGSFDSDNVYIEGDSLEVLKMLQRGYHGRIGMIYIDPPYNTGNDFVYKDDFGDTIANYKKQTGLIGQSNADTSGRYHSDWCSMMYPRLRLARELLSDEGVIFISIDDNENANLRKICDEIFGPQCFVSDISWQRTYSIRNDSKGMPVEVEHLLCYSRLAGWSPKQLPRTAEMNAKYSNPDNDWSAWRTDNAFASDAKTHQGMVYAIQHPFTGELVYPPYGSHWRYAQNIMLEAMSGWCEYHLVEINDAEVRARICQVPVAEVRPGVKALMLTQSIEKSREQAEIVLKSGPWPKFFFTKNGKGGIARKTYLKDVGGRLPTNFWPFAEVGHTDEAKKELQRLFNGNAPFDTPKPVRLLERMLSIASSRDSIILDFFSGSGTMAEAVIRKNLEDQGNRKFIMVQLPEKAAGQWETLCDVGEERIRRAGNVIRAETDDTSALPDIGFRVLALDESGIMKPEQGLLFDNVVRSDRSDLDIVFEMMLKWGLELTLPVTRAEAAGYPIWSVACNELVCCMADNLTHDALEAVASMEPRRVLILDSILTDTLKLNAIEIFKHAGKCTGHEIELRTI